MTLKLTPVTISDAKVFIRRHHRRLPPRVSALFAIGVAQNSQIVGVATVARPSARHLDQRYTAEVTRLCVLDGVPNACSMLYAACWRAAKAMGFTRIITYTATDESGASVAAAGWSLISTTHDHPWSTPARPRSSPQSGPNNLWAKGEDTGRLRPSVQPNPRPQLPLWQSPPDTETGASP